MIGIKFYGSRLSMHDPADADELPKIGAKALLKAADCAAKYSNVLLLENPDDEDPIAYWANQSVILRNLADEWAAPEDGWKDGVVVPWRGPAKAKALPPERPR